MTHLYFTRWKHIKRNTLLYKFSGYYQLSKFFIDNKCNSYITKLFLLSSECVSILIVYFSIFFNFIYADIVALTMRPHYIFNCVLKIS